jgi:hypothetical protein
LSVSSFVTVCSASSTSRRTSWSISRWVCAETSETPGSSGPLPSLGSTDTGPTLSLIPHRPTIERAIWVSCWMSDSAPVVISPYTTCSATRPPSDTRILASRSSSVYDTRSASGVDSVTPSA